MVELLEKSRPETGRLGAKVLSFPDVIAQSVGFMGPVFTSAFVIPLVVGVASVTGKGGGIASPLSVLIAGIGVFAIGWIVSSYAKEVRTAGSLYEYVTRGLGERIGTAAGWLYYAGVTMLTAALLLILGGYLQSTIASEFSVNPLPGWAWSLIFLAIVALVLYFGVRISTRVQLGLALISIIVVTVFFISVIVKLGSANSFKPFRPSSSADGWPGIFFGVLYGILLFTGFESSANLAEETPKPAKHIRAAVMSTAGIATIFFVLATYVEVAGFHYSLKTLGAAASAPLFALGAGKSAGGYGGTWIDRLLELVVLFDMLAVGIGCGVSATRGIFAMAEDGRVPGPLAVVSKRRSSPLGATVFVTGFCAVALLADVFWKGLFALPETPHYDALFSWGSTFGGFALVVVYLLMAIGSLRSFAHSPRRLWLVLSAVLAILITAGAIFGSFDKVTSPTVLAPWFALAVLVIGFASTWVTRARRSAGSQSQPALLCDPSHNPAHSARDKLVATSAELRIQAGEKMQSHPAKIVRADETDSDAIITILSTGFQNDPVSRWLFPDDDARKRLHPKFFAPFVKMALEDGEIYTTEDRSGTALWFPATSHHEDQPGLGELYEPILGADYAKRIAAFDERSTANHPDHKDHFYLPFIAVRPQFFGQGIGTALLRDRLAALDSQGVPTYLEASNRDSARLYERLGYKRLDRTTDMPGGPSLYPMWRDPA